MKHLFTFILLCISLSVQAQTFKTQYGNMVLCYDGESMDLCDDPQYFDDCVSFQVVRKSVHTVSHTGLVYLGDYPTGDGAVLQLVEGEVKIVYFIINGVKGIGLNVNERLTKR